MKLRRFELTVLILNGCFSLLLSVTICLANIVLIVATAKYPLRPERAIDKVHNAFFYTNLMASIMFLPYFGVAEILHGLEITSTTIRFPSYLSSTFFVFAQANVQVSLFTSIERCTAFVSPHLHRRLTTRKKSIGHVICNRVIFAAFCVFIVYWDKRTGLLHNLHPCVLFIPDVVTNYHYRSHLLENKKQK